MIHYIHMDLHPIIVHFPVALLTIYALLEILTFNRKLRAGASFFAIKAFLLVVGFLGSIAATISGEHALQLSGQYLSKEISHAHEEYGEMTRNVFGLLTLIYLSMYLKHPRIQKIGDFFKKYFFITIILAIVGLILVSITGALGGALVYGAESKDPFIGFVVKLLGLE